MSNIRLTGGKFSRHLLQTPTTGTHPMSERARLALFNMLDCSRSTVLDLFAGSGALGLEALSRGASSATFVDKSPAACQIIRANLSSLGLSAPVICASIANFSAPTPYDFVFVDPPYDRLNFFTADSITFYSNFVKSGATLVISHPQNTQITPPDTLKLITTRQYASLTLDIFSKL